MAITNAATGRTTRKPTGSKEPAIKLEANSTSKEYHVGVDLQIIGAKASKGRSQAFQSMFVPNSETPSGYAVLKVEPRGDKPIYKGVGRKHYFGRLAPNSLLERQSIDIIELLTSARYRNVFEATPQDRIATVKRGIPPVLVESIARSMATTASSVINMLGLSRSTVARKKADGEKRLSVDDSEKLLGLAKLVGQVEVIVNESGNPEGFDAGKWLNTWLNKPIGALNGQKPAEFMDTAEGQGIISNLLSQIQHGVYA